MDVRTYHSRQQKTQWCKLNITLCNAKTFYTFLKWKFKVILADEILQLHRRRLCCQMPPIIFFLTSGSQMICVDDFFKELILKIFLINEWMFQTTINPHLIIQAVQSDRLLLPTLANVVALWVAAVHCGLWLNCAKASPVWSDSVIHQVKPSVPFACHSFNVKMSVLASAASTLTSLVATKTFDSSLFLVFSFQSSLPLCQ